MRNCDCEGDNCKHKHNTKKDTKDDSAATLVSLFSDAVVWNNLGACEEDASDPAQSQGREHISHMTQLTKSVGDTGDDDEEDWNQDDYNP